MNKTRQQKLSSSKRAAYKNNPFFERCFACHFNIAQTTVPINQSKHYHWASLRNWPVLSPYVASNIFPLILSANKKLESESSMNKRWYAQLEFEVSYQHYQLINCRNHSPACLRTMLVKAVCTLHINCTQMKLK